MHIDKISERKIYSLLYNTISNETRAKKKKEGWNEIVGPSNRILCHRFDETDGRFRNKDFIAGQRSVSEISIVLFEHPRFAHSVVVDCIVFRTSSIRRPEGGGRRTKKRGKRNTPFPYAQRPLPELVTIDISYLVSRIP